MDRINQREVARLLGVSTATLQKWRRFPEENKGPRPFFKVSQNLIVYPRKAVEEWLEAHRGSSSEREPATTK